MFLSTTLRFATAFTLGVAVVALPADALEDVDIEIATDDAEAGNRIGRAIRNTSSLTTATPEGLETPQEVAAAVARLELLGLAARAGERVRRVHSAR